MTGRIAGAQQHIAEEGIAVFKEDAFGVRFHPCADGPVTVVRLAGEYEFILHRNRVPTI